MIEQKYQVFYWNYSSNSVSASNLSGRKIRKSNKFCAVCDLKALNSANQTFVIYLRSVSVRGYHCFNSKYYWMYFCPIKTMPHEIWMGKKRDSVRWKVATLVFLSKIRERILSNNISFVSFIHNISVEVCVCVWCLL